MAAMADVIGLGVLLRWKDKASANIKKAERAVDNLGESVDEVTEKTARLQHGFAKLGKAGAALTAFGVAGALTFFGVTKAAGTFEDTLRDTMTMTGLTGKAFNKMERELGVLALQMSTRFGMSASDINKSFYQVLSSGAQAGTKQFEALSESALRLAKVVGMEPAVAVESLSDALHSFEMDVKNAEKMADVFFKTSMLGATTVPQMAEAMKEASKVAVEMKIPLEDAAAVLTGFAGKGIKGAEAGTAFRMIMTKLAAPAKDAREALAKLGVQVYDSTTKKMRPILDVFSDMQKGLAHITHEEREAALKAIAGEEAFSKLGGLLATDLSLLRGWSKELKVGGVMQTAFTQKSRTLNFAFAAMKESLRNVAIVLGQQLLPVITPALGRIALFAGKIREFLSAHPVLTKTAVLFGAIAAAVALIVGPILTVVGIIGALGGIPAILGMVAAGFASLGAAAIALGGLISAAFWPVTAVAAGVALLYLAFKSNFLGIRTIVVSVGKVLWSFFKGIWAGVKSALYPLVTAFRETWAALKEAFSPVVEGGKAIGELLGISIKGSAVMKAFGETARVLGKVIGFALVTPMRLALTAVTWLMRGFAFLIIKAGEVIEWVSSKWGAITGVMLSPVGLVLKGWDVLKEGLIATFAAIKETVLSAFTSIKDSIAGVLDWIWGKVSWVIARIPDVLLPEGLKDMKADLSLAGPGEMPVGGRMKVPATAPAVQPAMPRPTFPGKTAFMPAPALAGAGGPPSSIDQSIHIGPGAIVINATRIDETAAMKIDRELAKLLERRRERK